MAPAYRDCIAMDFLLEETLRQRSHGLKLLCKDYLGVEMEQFEAVFKGREFGDVLTDDPESALRYAGLDALATTLICDILQRLLSQRPAREGYDSFELYQHWERPFHTSLRRIQRTGIPLSRERLVSWHQELSAEVEEIDGTAYSHTGKVINLSSNKELCSWYYGVCGKPVALTTGGFTCILCDRLVTKRTNYNCPLHGRGALVNSPSVNDEVLERFVADGDELAVLLQRRRTLEKKRSTWIDGFYRLSTESNWGYPTIRSTYVVSGRLSAGIWLTTPGDLRDIFAFPPEDDRVLLRLDYSQLELRLLAHESSDPNMLSAFETGKDLHCWTAGLLVLLRERGNRALSDNTLKESYYQQVLAAKGVSDSKQPLSERSLMLLESRQIAKTVNFGIAYGMGADKFARQQGTTIEEANSVFDAVWAMYSQVREYFKSSIAAATTSGELKTLIGRNRRIPELASNSPSQRSYGERLVKNSPCQAGGADVIRAAMILVDLDIEAGGGYGTAGRGAYGTWTQGRWEPDWDYLPKGWRQELPGALSGSLGELGRLGFKMCLQVHDELLFFGPEANAEAAGARVKELMEDPFGGDLSFSVPLTVSVGIGKSWDAAK
jgi:DNA polymerase-1